MSELSQGTIKAVAAGATFKMVGDKLEGLFTSFEQAAAAFGSREKALKYLSSVWRGRENHETVSSHPLSRTAKQLLSSGMYFVFSGDKTDECSFTEQVGKPQKGKKGEEDYEEASEDFEPAKYKGLKKVIKFLESKKEEASKPA